MKRVTALLLGAVLALAALLSFAACGKKEPAPTYSNFVTIEVQDYGEMRIELFPRYAPMTVANFQKLVSQGFYNGLTFHRVIPGFMVQGGDPLGNGTGGSPNTVTGEFASNGYTNPMTHKRGTISMARSNDYNSASSQFFIVHKDSPHLDGEYAAFGRIVDDEKYWETLDKIAAVQTDLSEGKGGKPLTPVVITRIYFS